MKFFLKTKENDDRKIFITGNFNRWNPQDPHFELIQNGIGYSIEIPDSELPERIEYKFTKGGWENVELDQYANITANRRIVKDERVSEDLVEKWRFNWGPFKKEFFPIVTLISDHFYIPQLDRYRKVWILLPFDYYKSEKDYPVLYLQDAQNLFNEGSPFGNWEIDKKLSILEEYGRGDVIVVAVDHGEGARTEEYVVDTKKGDEKNTKEYKDAQQFSSGASGKKYIRFISDTLKPYIDAHFRTKPQREFTGIGGSSLGGLISIYGGFLYPEVYSKLLIFSPSLWLEPYNNFPVINFRNPFKTKVYLYGGEKEGSRMVKRIHQFEKAMSKWQNDQIFDFEIRTSINPEGKHQEFYWSQEFPKAVEWLYYDNAKNPLEVTPKLEEKQPLVPLRHPHF